MLYFTLDLVVLRKKMTAFPHMCARVVAIYFFLLRHQLNTIINRWLGCLQGFLTDMSNVVCIAVTWLPLPKGFSASPMTSWDMFTSHWRHMSVIGSPITDCLFDNLVGYRVPVQLQRVNYAKKTYHDLIMFHSSTANKWYLLTLCYMPNDLTDKIPKWDMIVIMSLII